MLTLYPANWAEILMTYISTVKRKRKCTFFRYGLLMTLICLIQNDEFQCFHGAAPPGDMLSWKIS